MLFKMLQLSQATVVNLKTLNATKINKIERNEFFSILFTSKKLVVCQQFEILIKMYK